MESIPELTSVRPVKPAAPYIGGKRNLARRLVERIEAVTHLTYAEPFVGMGGVFFRRRRRPRCEVINDLAGDVWTFYRVLQEHYPYFIDHLRFRLTTRAEFERLVKVDPATLTDIQRAARFLYLQRTAFGGKVDQRHFGVSHHRPGRFDMARLGPMLDDLHERLTGVIVERLGYAEFIARYDTPETLFFLDPPYWDSEGDYGPGLFSKVDFVLLVAALKAVRGRFILTINDVPETRELFAWATIEPVDVAYGITGQGATPARELIVTGGGS